MFRIIIVFTQEEYNPCVFIINTRVSSRCKNTSIRDLQLFLYSIKKNESQVHKKYHRAELILFYFKRLERINI